MDEDLRGRRGPEPNGRVRPLSASVADYRAYWVWSGDADIWHTGSERWDEEARQAEFVGTWLVPSTGFRLAVLRLSAPHIARNGIQFSTIVAGPRHPPDTVDVVTGWPMTVNLGILASQGGAIPEQLEPDEAYFRAIGRH